jgi:hypothetical protein
MKPIRFSQANCDFGLGQDEYLPLPAYTDEIRTISCWQLTWFERLFLLFTGKLWLHQLNFGDRLQPQLVSLVDPFVEGEDA